MELLWANSRSSGTRVYLDRGKVQRLSDECQVICVLAGTAWITHDGIDLIVNSGEQIAVRSGKYPALISAVGTNPLVYEVHYTTRYPR